MLLTRAKRLLKDEELEEYLKLTPIKQKKYLEDLQKELFTIYEYNIIK